MAFLTLLYIGWILMVTGFSMTLYSRLHLIVFKNRILRALLAMVVVNGCIVHIPSVVTGYLDPTPQLIRANIILSKVEVVF